MSKILIGCAGWSLRKEQQPLFPEEGTHLQRYAQRLTAVEINSSFYRSHRQTTYQRWADSTPEQFRFAVKMPRQITHLNRLKNSSEALRQFASEVSGLGPKLGTVLVQLPPSLPFEPTTAEAFFNEVTSQLGVPISFEPRHRSWFSPPADELIQRMGLSRVAADPAPVPAAATPSGNLTTVYYRWHGSPQMYVSNYSEATLADLAQQLIRQRQHCETAWCIFDNTTEGAATLNALRLIEMLDDQRTDS